MDASKLTSTTLGLSVAIFAVMLGVSQAMWGTRMALGVLVGGLLTLGNFVLLRWTVQQTLVPGQSGGAGRLLGVFVLKFVLLAGILGLALWSGRVHVLGLFLGCSVVVLAVLALAPILGLSGLTEEEGHGGRN
jgi:hypothetical protein